MKGRLQDKVALVTGGGSGIGRASALAFAREGAKVVVVDVVVESGQETVQMIQKDSGEAIFVKADVSIPVAIEALISEVIKVYGQLDCAHNNAGIVGDSGASVTDCTEDNWDRIINLNLKGVWLCMKHEIRQMRKQGHGVIVNTSSIGGLRAAPDSGAYGPSKAGINHISRQAAEENKDMAIRVHAVCPGMIKDTGLTDRLWYSSDKMGVPRPREAEAGLPEDVGKVVVWLCSNEASFVNGAVIAACGSQFIS